MYLLTRVVLRPTSLVCRGCSRSVHSSSSRDQYFRLLEIGKLESPQPSGYYPAAQFFLHRVFGYRGVVLFPWTANVYDRDISRTTESSSGWEEEGLLYSKVKGLQAQSKPYYQVLIDNKDFPYVRTHPEAITFLASSKDTSLYSLPGLDYVAHEDILPYTSTGQDSFSHQLFPQFFVPSGDKQGSLFLPRDVLSAWREKNHKWLTLSDVHRESTAGVRVSVMPFYMGSKDEDQGTTYWWRYNIRLECLSGERLVLRERHWRIYSGTGFLETVKGRGVIGQEPVFSSAQPCFQYSSHVSLKSPSGHMWGTFLLERGDKSSFEVRVPPFTLDSSRDDEQS
ncbi:polymerase delta-interacting protein 2-like isoform X2 [Halichondria panicea]|uniref:polymerase delta-interacting protein 2-like isoform X2 n=1 Tax=Halichondria panicea TaxID=6063 RepID=UPI00312B9396